MAAPVWHNGDSWCKHKYIYTHLFITIRCQLANSTATCLCSFEQWQCFLWKSMFGTHAHTITQTELHVIKMNFQFNHTNCNWLNGLQYNPAIIAKTRTLLLLLKPNVASNMMPRKVSNRCCTINVLLMVHSHGTSISHLSHPTPPPLLTLFSCVLWSAY